MWEKCVPHRGTHCGKSVAHILVTQRTKQSVLHNVAHTLVTLCTTLWHITWTVGGGIGMAQPTGVDTRYCSNKLWRSLQMSSSVLDEKGCPEGNALVHGVVMREKWNGSCHYY